MGFRFDTWVAVQDCLLVQIRSARRTKFIEPDQSDASSPVLMAKIIRFPPDPNHLYIPRRPVPPWGRIAIVTNAGRDAVDVRRRVDEGAWLADGEVVWS